MLSSSYTGKIQPRRLSMKESFRDTATLSFQKGLKEAVQLFGADALAVSSFHVKSNFNNWSPSYRMAPLISNYYDDTS